MKFIILFLMSFSAGASVLPSEYGSEVSVVLDGFFDAAQGKFIRQATYLDLVTTKVLKDKAQLSGSAVLGSDNKHLSASFFYKVNEFFSVGASSYSSVSFQFGGEVTILGRFPYKKFFFMPFITLSDLQDSEGRLGRFGMKTYYKDIGSLIASFVVPEKGHKDLFYFSVGFSIPIHNVKVFDFLIK